MQRKRVQPPDDRTISALAAEQHGVVARSQLLRRGIGAGAIEHRLRLKRLHRVHQGVYTLGSPCLLRREGHWMAAVLAYGSGAVLSHAAAGAHWDLRGSNAGVVDVTVERAGGRRRQRGIRVHRSLTLTADQCTIHEGIPVTTVARTLIDLADRYDQRTAERATDQAEVLRLFDLTRVEAAIEANPGRRGAAVLGRLLEAYKIGAGLTESELEDEFFHLCDRFAILRPEPQVRLGPDRVDFLWREQRLAVETDGWRWHGGRNAWESDQRRDIRLQRMGLRVARFSYLRIFRDPVAVAADLKALLAITAAPSAAPRRAG